jgi:hypothetical protein
MRSPYGRTRAQSAASRRNAQRAQVSRIGTKNRRLPKQYRILKKR